MDCFVIFVFVFFLFRFLRLFSNLFAAGSSALVEETFKLLTGTIFEVNKQLKHFNIVLFKFLKVRYLCWNNEICQKDMCDCMKPMISASFHSPKWHDFHLFYLYVSKLALSSAALYRLYISRAAIVSRFLHKNEGLTQK